MLAATGNLTPALYHYQKAVELKPDDPQGWRKLAEFCLDYYFEIRSIAISSARQVLWLDPGSARSLTLMGKVLTAAGDKFSAIRFLNRAVNTDPNHAAAYIELGKISLDEGQRGQAFNYLLKAKTISIPATPEGITSRRLLKAYFGMVD